jgi:hypothetical protein
MNRTNRTFRVVRLFGVGIGFAALGCMPTTPVAKPTRASPVAVSRPLGALSDPKTVLEDAIQAMGGEATLRRKRHNFCTGEGQTILLNQPERFRFKTISSLPGRKRDEWSFDNGVTIIQVVDGEKGWVSENKVDREMDPVNLKAEQEQLYVNYLLTLIPLKGPAFTLQALPEQRKDGYLCQAFRVKSAGRRDVTLFFDQESHLPLVLKTIVFDPNRSIEKDEETYFRDYKDLDGLKFATRWVVYNEGNKAMEITFNDFKLLEKVEDQFFTKP